METSSNVEDHVTRECSGLKHSCASPACIFGESSWNLPTWTENSNKQTVHTNRTLLIYLNSMQTKSGHFTSIIASVTFLIRRVLIKHTVPTKIKPQNFSSA